MFVSLRMITLPPERAGEGAREALADALRIAAAGLAGVCSCWIAPVSPIAVINAGHVVWRMGFASEAEALAAPLDPLWRQHIAPLLEGTQVTGVGYRITHSAVQ